jgi:putative membrane protein
MKKNYLSLIACVLATAIWSCGSNNNTSGSNADSTGTTTTGETPGSNPGGTGATDSSNASATSGGSATNSTAATNMKLGKEDSTFVMKAAVGGMEEVELGNLAQQTATNQRVKDFGAMMVRDHSKANDELKSLASSRGITLPASLPPDKQKMVDNMKKMTGKSFDSHYVTMMVQDHQKDVSEFKKESTAGKDNDVKNWAAKTLPVLQTHLDSIQAIKKGM